MSIALRLLLITTSVMTLVLCGSRIRKSTLKIDDSIFWFTLSVIIVLLAVFPKIAMGLSSFLGIESPANLVFLIMIFLLLVKSFQQTLTIAKFENKIERIAYDIAKNKLNIERKEPDGS